MNPDNMKKNWALWVGIAIPIVAIAVVFVISLMSQRGFTPQYDFLYHFDNGYDYCYQGNSYYYVKDGVVNQGTVSPSYLNAPECLKRSNTTADDSFFKLYRYSVTDDKSYPITLAEAQKLKVDVGPISPVGETIQQDYGSNAGIFEIFGGRNNSSNGAYFLLSQDKKIKKISIVNSTGVNYYNFKFIGWVLK
jgi:hypothetical protein